MKFVKNILIGIAVAALCVTAAKAQFQTYRSFINGYNLQVTSTNTIGGLVTNTFGGTSTYNSLGYNGYTYPGFFPAAGTNNIGTNTIVGTTLAFGLQTNAYGFVDAPVWPDNNSDASSDEGVFVSITGVNTATTNTYLLTFAAEVDFPINLPPPSPNLSVFPGVPGTGTLTNAVACTLGYNQFSITATANGLTPVNLITNAPALVMLGHKLRLLSIAATTTNITGIGTNTSYSMTLTNGVWQNVTNTTTVTNWGVYVNAGLVGFPPFHSP
jgi:hypothetical protein